jgi:hypothetical protein
MAANQMIYMEGRSLDGVVATCDLPTLHALLRHTAYLRTLVRRILAQLSASTNSAGKQGRKSGQR